MRHRVLGLGGSNHDFSAALIVDGRIVVAIEDERLQGIKRGRAEWHSEPARDAAMYCLESQGIGQDELDGIFCCDDLERPTDWMDWSKVTFVNHHTAHAAAAYFPFPHERSTLLVIDGHGSPVRDMADGYEVETISVGWAERSSIAVEPLQTGMQKRTSSSWRYVTQNSIGWFYSIVTSALGFGSGGQGKAMGLAAYGTPALTGALADFVRIEPDGRFLFDPYNGIWDWLNDTLRTSIHPVQLRADLAYAAQEILVSAVIAAAREAHHRAPSDVLGFGGGCALNTLANSRILESTPFRHLAVFPAAGDNGLAIGAALYGAHTLLGHPRPTLTPGWQGRMAYLGRHYGPDEIDAALAGAPVIASRPADLVGEVARFLADGQTVALCREASEIGPRALGHRSLLALPASAKMRDQINLNIKRRESFRPLAPMVRFEDLDTYFEGARESPHMLLVASVRQEQRARLAAVTHIDGTARVQTVRREDEAFLYDLLGRIGEATGMPVLLNTSLNLPDKPIVESPADALALFVQSPIDVLVLGERVVTKYTPWVPATAMPASLQGRMA